MIGIHKKLVNSLTAWLTQNRPPPRYPLADFTRLRHEVRTGDVLLIEGRSRVSDVIRQMTQSAWTHAALYLGRLHDVENPMIRQRLREFYQGPPDEQLLLESELDRGTVITPIRHYEQDHIRICRPRNLSRHDAQQVIAFAIGKLGTEYNVRHLFDLARLLLPWSILPRRWRSYLFQTHAVAQARQICSSLIAESFLSIDYPVLPLILKNPRTGMKIIPRNPKLFTPRDFDYSPYFDIIKYPMFELQSVSAHRYLPWVSDKSYQYNDQDAQQAQDAHEREL